MGLGTKASDWEVCGLGDVGAARQVAAGIFLFDFRSQTAGITGRFRMSGAGMGVGGNASGTMIPLPDGMPLNHFTAIECDEPFSLYDLDNCWGRITTAGVGKVLGWGICYITAAPAFFSTRAYFHSQNVGGWGTTFSPSAMVIIGGWHFSNVVADIGVPTRTG